MSDTLRLVASVEDRYTGPLAKLKRGVHEVADETRRHVGAMGKDWETARAGVERFRGVLGGVAPVLSGLGVTGMGAALSVGGLATAVGDFSSKTRSLSQVAKDVGLTIDQLRTFQALGEKFGVTAETMTGAAKAFASQMWDLKRGGAAYTDLFAMNQGKLAEDLRNSKNLQEAWTRMIKGIQAMPDNEVKRKVSRMYFGTDDISIIAQNLVDDIDKVMIEIPKSIGRMSKETEQAAKDFQTHMNHISEWAERTKLKFLGPLVKVLSDTLDFDPNNEDGQLKYLRGRREDLDKKSKVAPEGSFQRRYFENQREGVADEIRKLEEATRKGTAQGVKDALRDQQGGVPTVQQQSFNGPGSGGSLIQKAAWGGFGGPLGGSQGAGPLGGNGGGSAGPTGPLQGSSEGLGGPAGRSAGRGGSGANEGSQRDTPTPRGNGRGNAGAAKTAAMMRYGMDQLRREGVPEAQLRQAAGHLVGQAQMESGLNPNTVHDQGTGYGIYGARLGRRSRMLGWLKKHGYAPNSAEGQMRYMAHEAMNDPTYRPTRRVLMGEGSGDVDRDTDTITRNFERPKVINRRSGAVRNAIRIGPEKDPEEAKGPLAPDAAKGPLSPEASKGPLARDTFEEFRAERERAARDGQLPGEDDDEGGAFRRWKAERAAAAEARDREAAVPKGDGAGPDIAGDISGRATYNRGKMDAVKGFVVHHTATRGTPESVVDILNKRGLGVQFVMDRDGKIFRTLPEGARGAHMRRSQINDLSNANTLGMEVIARDDKDVTKAQAEAGRAFLARMRKRYPDLQVHGHGEVNPGHKQATEGMTIVRGAREDAAAAKTAEAPKGSSKPAEERPGQRAGDAMMRRHYAGQILGARPQEHRLKIDLNGFPAGTKTSATMDSLFKDTAVTRGPSQMSMEA